MNQKQLRKTWLCDCVPTVFALVMSGLYSVMDGLFIGRAVGDIGLAAVNIAWPIPAVITAAGIGIGTGGSILYSNQIGQGNRDIAEKWYRCAVRLLIIVGLFLTVFFYVCYPGILRALGAEGEVYEQASDYSRIIALGGLLQVMGAGMVPLLRNLGEILKAAGSMLMGMLVNICLNYILIFHVGMGIRGAAVGTVTAQFVVTVSALVFGYKRRSEKKQSFEFGYEKMKDTGGRRTFKKERLLIKTGFSAFGLSLAPSVVLIFTNYRCLKYGGATAAACYAVISYITFPVQYLLAGIGDGSQPLMSFYNGSGKDAELMYIRKIAERTAIFTGAALMCVTFIVSGRIPRVFGLSKAAGAYFRTGMRISSGSFLFMGAARFHISYLGAVLRTKEASALIYMETLAVSPLFLIVFPNVFGIEGIWWSLPATQAVMLFIFNLFFTKRKGKI